ncbi:uncharacterized protein LOC117220924 [Megalopta genalis]|uniref:uncharacterized protein LOC117220924 n=1 Tax=Megalopta genalis TaxID=115081 RepID=UPI001443208B|nr:uncharacterized protein LOC117220924 isoform X1 [Megalopta genalis]XP_033327283.1 uncharacterized protein LOC117220924 isoform X2 [Megalopta genalis]
MEFTLADTYNMLKDTRTERLWQIDELVLKSSEMNASSSSQYNNVDEIPKKQSKMCISLLNEIAQEEPKDYPLPKSSHIEEDVMSCLRDEIKNTLNLQENMKDCLSEIQQDIAYLQDKKIGLKNMESVYIEQAEHAGTTTYSAEEAITKNIFHEVKQDLDDVVDILFPENQEIRQFLSLLTISYTKGGDDVYVDMTPDVIDFANFLIEADIATKHRNDSNKIRLMDML